jgi:hypothetical protein
VLGVFWFYSVVLFPILDAFMLAPIMMVAFFAGVEEE